MEFSKTELSVSMNIGKAITVTNGVQNVHRQRSHTLAVEYATDNHPIVVKWKAMSEWASLSNIDFSKLKKNIGNCNFRVLIYNC